MTRELTALIRPQTIAVIGASATKEAQGNLVIDNLLSRGYAGEIIPVHREAEAIQGLKTVCSIEQLPEAVDLVIASVPASVATQTLRELEARHVKSAIYFAAGFSAKDGRAFRQAAQSSQVNILGPNCMGLINCSDATFLYPAKTPTRLKKGSVALLAQSGSAAITVMNSADVGFSKIITVGSEFQLTTVDYLTWLAEDEETTTVGIVMESIQDPASFSQAVKYLYLHGKSLAVLKVGQSRIGGEATIAHTGSMTQDSDTYDLFFRDNDIYTVHDYDELAATLQCLEAWRSSPGKKRVALAGISGGQTALACDVAETLELPLATFSKETVNELRAVLPGTPGRNPVDFGAVVNPANRDTNAAIRKILDDPETDVLALLQDCQSGLSERSQKVYGAVVESYCRAVAGTKKPVIVISPTSGEVDEKMRAELHRHGIPLIRGLREGLVAIKALASRQSAIVDSIDADRDPIDTDLLLKLREELSGQKGQVSPDIIARLLSLYKIPLVRSILAKDGEEAASRADEVGFPMVVKIASPDIAHRSELGGVVLGVADVQSLKEAVKRISENIENAASKARIVGYELQSEFTGDLEAVVGAVSAAPFGSKIIVGSGGTLVELLNDTAQGLAPLSAVAAEGMIRQTMLGARMEGYRNLIPPTSLAPLANLVKNMSLLMHDFGDIIAAFDLNPVLIRKSTGEVLVVDTLMEAHGASSEAL